MEIIYQITVSVFRSDGEDVDQEHPGFLEIKANYKKALEDMNRMNNTHHLEIQSVEEVE
ncbi:MAG: hypothetical protein OEW23_12920 [Candidatus Aminicenantes bacterium]|nr:hypothetical protein [Candidatus Aminicenantes bacterium]